MSRGTRATPGAVLRFGAGLAFGWLLIVLSCASDPALVAHDRAALAAERHLSEGEALLALSEFERLESRTSSGVERVELRLRQVEALRRAERLAEALERLRALRVGCDGCVEPVELPAWTRAKVLYTEARLVLDGGDEPGGRALLRRVVATFADTEWAPRALQLLSLRAKEDSADWALWVEWCRARFDASPQSSLADNLAYEVARYYFERNTEADDAVAERAYNSILTRFTIRSSGLWDDALWDLSLIYNRRGRYVDERALLERFLAERVEASAPGSYEHPNYKQAWLRIGRLLLTEFGEPAAAARHFAEFPEVFRLALIRSEARYLEALAWQRAGETERAEAARQALLRDFPDSKWARRLVAERGRN